MSNSSDDTILVHSLLIILSLLTLVTGGLAAQDVKTTSLRLNNADVVEALKTVCDQSSYNLAVGAGVKGNVTIHVDSIKALEAVAILTELAGAAYVVNGKTVKVMTQNQYVEQYGKQPFDKRRMKVFELSYVSPGDIITELNKLKSAKGIILTDATADRLYILETRPVLDMMKLVIESSDTERRFRGYDLKFITPTALEQTLQLFLTPSAVTIPDPSRNRLVVVDRPDKLDWLDSLIAEFDKPSELITRTLRLQHAPVARVTGYIEGMLTPNAGHMIADDATSQIIVTDLPDVVESISDLVSTLDKRTKEVFIEAKIVQVSLSDDLKTGVNWQALTNRIPGGNVSGDFNVLSASDQGLRMGAGILGEKDYEVVLEALAETGKTDLLSSPHITAVLGKESRILVGSSIPYKTIDTREENGSIRTFEKVTIVEVGVKLFVTALSADDSGYVRLSIKPEVSSVVSFSDNVPVVEKTEAETEVIIRDGVTLIIGGLIKKEQRKTVKGVPLLSSIPLLGRLFSSVDSQDVKSELIIFLTPHIITGDVTQKPAAP